MSAMQAISGNVGTSAFLGPPLYRTIHPNGVSIRFERWMLEADGRGRLMRLTRIPAEQSPSILGIYVAMTLHARLPDDKTKPSWQAFTAVRRACDALATDDSRLVFSHWHPKDHCTAVLDQVVGGIRVGVGPLNSITIDGVGVKEILLNPMPVTEKRRPRLLPQETLLRAAILQYLREKPAGMQTLRPFGIRLVSEPIPAVRLKEVRTMNPELGRSQRWVYTATIGSHLICLSAKDARVLWHTEGLGNGTTTSESVGTAKWGVWLGGERQGWLHPTPKVAKPTHRVLLQQGNELQFAGFDSQTGLLQIETPRGATSFRPDDSLARAIEVSIKACPVPE